MSALFVETIFIVCMVFQFVTVEQEEEIKAAVVSILVADLTEESDQATFESLSSMPKCNVVVLNNLKSNLVERIPNGRLPLDFGRDLSDVNPHFDAIRSWLVSENRTVVIVYANKILSSLGSYSLSQFDGIHFGNDDFRRPFFQRLEEKNSKHEFGLVILNLDADTKVAIDQLLGLSSWVHPSSRNPPSIMIIKYQQPEIRKYISKEMFEENCEVLSSLQSESIVVLAANFEQTTSVKLEQCKVDEENKNVSEVFKIRLEFAEVDKSKGIERL